MQALRTVDVRTELSWTHYRNLLRVENEQARNWYMNEAASQNWTTRALDRQIGTLYYERLLASRDKEPVQNEVAAHNEAAAHIVSNAML
jgi:predicted nuclease of restriction endonuclease-like (RecB) superfamily